MLAAGNGCRVEQGQLSEAGADKPPPPIALPGPGTTRATERFSDVEPEVPIERPLHGGESHSYRLPLDRGDFLDLVIDQRGVDVVSTLHEPGGLPVLSIDGSDGAWGPERMRATAKVSGVYRLEVQPLSDTAEGHYALRVEAPHPASERERSIAAGARAYAEGEKLRQQGDLRGAVARYEEASGQWRKAEERAEEAIALRRLGQAWRGLGQPRIAIGFLEQSLAISHQLGEKRQRARTLIDAGVVYRLLGEPHRAQEAYETALSFYVSTHNLRGEATALHNIALIRESLGYLQQALGYYNRALAIWRELEDRRAEAVTLHVMGNSYFLLGRWAEAYDVLELALELRRATGDRHGEALTLTGIGWVYHWQGETDRALESYRAALALRRELGDEHGEAVTLDRLASTLVEMGQLEKARETYRSALRVFVAEDDRFSQAQTLINLGHVHELLGEPQRALEHYERASQHFRDLEDANGEAHALMGRARAARGIGDFMEALRRTEQALAIVESLRTGIHSLALRSSYSAARHNYYEFHVDLLMELDDREPLSGYQVRALEVTEQARARGLLESLREARASIRGGADPRLLDRERSLMERIRAKEERRTLLLADKVDRPKIDDLDKELRALFIEFEEIQAQIRLSSPRYAALTQPEAISVAQIQSQLLDEETVLLSYSLGEARSFLWLVCPDSVQDYTLPPRKRIESLARRLHGLMNKSRLRGKSVSAKLAAEALGDILLRPAADRLEARRLLIVSDGALDYVPFSALPRPRTQGEPLIVGSEVVRLPSASVLAELRRLVAGRPSAPKRVAILADPVFEADDPRVRPESTRTDRPPASMPASGAAAERSARGAGLNHFERLPFSRREAESIFAMLPREQTLVALDFAATRERVVSGELSQYQILHFATHGLLNSRHPELSGIVLSLVDEQGRPRDGFLRLHEIYNLDLSADLVVLSACRTALGKEIRGEGLMGLTRGFIYAGAARVIVTLWNVSDEATAELMERFYHGVLQENLRPAAALRAAQLSMLREPRWQAPYYWAGFSIQGEWR